MDISKLIRPHLIDIKAYASARSEYSGDGVMLDANENGVGSVIEGHFNRYPDPLQFDVKTRILAKLNPELSVYNIFCGNGSDEAIDLLIRAFCEPKRDSIMVFPPVFAMYEKCAQINNVAIQQVQLTKDFQLDIEAIKAAIKPETKMIFICHPNNPTGNLIHSEDIKIILDSFNGILVIDEAYIDFSNGHSWVNSILKYDNVVVLRTFSKAWGLAALRMGLAFGSKPVIEVLNKIKMPYNININTSKLVSEALGHQYFKLKEMVSEIVEEREQLAVQLSWLNCVKKIFPSDANFLLVKFEDPKTAYNFLKGKGIIVRDRSNLPLCEGCLRITVGNKKENVLLLEALKAFEAQNAEIKSVSQS
jgi:histidinol-phosphate aminotransferase